MAIYFSDLITQLNYPAVLTSIADDSIALEHGVYPAAFAIEPKLGTVYIGNAEEIADLIERFSGSGVTLSIITSTMCKRLEDDLQECKHNVLCVKSSTSQIYFTANSILSSADEITFPLSPMNRFIAELLEDRMETSLEMNTKAEEAGLSFTNRLVMLVIKPEDKLTKNLYHDIQDMGLGIASATYKGRILIFFEAEKTGEHPSINLERLSEILKKHNAYAAVSPTTTKLSAVSLFYEQCLSVIRLAPKLHPENGRILYVEDDLIYLAVDVLGESLAYKHNRISYLANPLLMKLYRYDKEHEDNLYKVTEAYIKNGKNTTQAAQTLFLHRNTVSNKLEKAESIMERSFSDPKLCYELYFSFIIYDYVSKVWSIDIDTILPRPRGIVSSFNTQYENELSMQRLQRLAESGYCINN